jgi:hypothetical protein
LAVRSSIRSASHAFARIMCVKTPAHRSIGAPADQVALMTFALH